MRTKHDPKLAIATTLLAVAGCGGEQTEVLDQLAGLHVSAEPRGHEFAEAVSVSLSSSRPSTIFYTLDGKRPSEDDALVYDGPIEVDSHTLLSFVALSEDGMWSQPGSELYMLEVDKTPPKTLPRMVSVSDTSIFFNASVGQTEPVFQTVRVKSIGTEPVAIRRVSLQGNPTGGGFFDPEIFELVSGHEVDTLAPGEDTVITIAYHPTDTLRTAILVIDSNAQVNDGLARVELWGRRINW